MIANLVNFFGDAKYTRIRWRLLLIILAIIVLADFLIERHDTGHFWDAIPGWGAVFGFASCAAIIFISKFIGHQGGIMKDEDYYD